MKEWVYINYDKPDGNTGTIHQEGCSHVIRALAEKSERMKEVKNGYWLAVRRMQDAFQVIRDLGANPRGCQDCRPPLVF